MGVYLWRNDRSSLLWWPLVAHVLNWFPVLYFKSMQFSWRLGASKWNVLAPKLSLNCTAITEMIGYRYSTSSNACQGDISDIFLFESLYQNPNISNTEIHPGTMMLWTMAPTGSSLPAYNQGLFMTAVTSFRHKKPDLFVLKPRLLSTRMLEYRYLSSVLEAFIETNSYTDRGRNKTSIPLMKIFIDYSVKLVPSGPTDMSISG